MNNKILNAITNINEIVDSEWIIDEILKLIQKSIVVDVDGFYIGDEFFSELDYPKEYQSLINWLEKNNLQEQIIYKTLDDYEYLKNC